MLKKRKKKKKGEKKGENEEYKYELGLRGFGNG